MTNVVDIETVRNRAWHYLEPSVAACAGLTLEQMQRFLSNSYRPTDEQLQQLARRMGMKER